MAKESFRFIHASDFHLERPLQDILDLPENLKKTLVDAPWKAAEAVFEHAVVENVDFVILCGDLLNPLTCGAAGVAFLLDQFETLRERNIEVYWAGGIVDDPERWPEAVVLPSNVHVFSKHEVEEFTFRRHQTPLVTLLGRSSQGAENIRARRIWHDPDDNFVIAVAFGKADSETLATERVDYWARRAASIRNTTQRRASYSLLWLATSSRLNEPGEHGFVLVDVDAQRNLQSTASISTWCATRRKTSMPTTCSDATCGNYYPSVGACRAKPPADTCS
ncbi:MAG: metallophosphoesterase [Pirellulaceae bacterium]